MITLCKNDLEIINGGKLGDWEVLLSCGGLLIGSIAYLASGPVSIPSTLIAIGCYNIGFIGSGVCIGNIIR